METCIETLFVLQQDMYTPVRPTFFRHMWQRFFLGVLLRGGEEGEGGAGRAERGVAATSLVLPTVPKTSVGGRGREREGERGRGGGEIIA